MAFRVAGVSVPGPFDVLGAAQAAAGWSARALEAAAGLPERLAAVLDDVEHLVRRVNAVADRADELVDRAAGVVGTAEKITATADRVVHDAAEITARAGRIVDEAETTTVAAGEILQVYKPIAGRAAPLAKRFVDELTEEEIHAAIKLIDHLPALTESLESDILPILGTLDRVGPDVHELLDVLKDVRQAINGIPGFRFFRRRGEEQEAEQRVEQERAAERATDG